MTQTPVTIKLEAPTRPTVVARPGLVQVLQTSQSLGGQSLLQSRQPVKSFATIRPFISNVPGLRVNTNTAIQYVRKPPEVAGEID